LLGQVYCRKSGFNSILKPSLPDCVELDILAATGADIQNFAISATLGRVAAINAKTERIT